MEIIERDGRLKMKELKVESKSKATNERASIVEYFVLPLNEERRKAKLKPLTAQFVAVKMAKIPTDQLYPFFKDCVRAKCGFSKAWWGSLKIKK